MLPIQSSSHETLSTRFWCLNQKKSTRKIRISRRRGNSFDHYIKMQMKNKIVTSLSNWANKEKSDGGTKSYVTTSPRLLLVFLLLLLAFLSFESINTFISIFGNETSYNAVAKDIWSYCILCFDVES